MASKDSAQDAERLPMPSRNPLPLSSTQEAHIREVYHNRVRRQCAKEIEGKQVRRLQLRMPDL